MTFSDIMNTITNAGFPVVVAAFLLFRLEKEISNLSASVNSLNNIISAKLGIPLNNEKE